jgi:hypothetical protein
MRRKLPDEVLAAEHRDNFVVFKLDSEKHARGWKALLETFTFTTRQDLVAAEVEGDTVVIRFEDSVLAALWYRQWVGASPFDVRMAGTETPRLELEVPGFPAIPLNKMQVDSLVGDLRKALTDWPKEDD